MIGGLANADNPTTSIINQNVPCNFTAQNSSTSVTYYQSINQEPQSEQVSNETAPKDGADNDKPPVEPTPGPSSGTDDNTPIEECEKIIEAFIKQSNTQDTASKDDTHILESDTPSPIEYSEGQIYILNQSMQFVRFHAQIGYMYTITSKGLQKVGDEEPSALTIKGKFSFKFQTV